MSAVTLLAFAGARDAIGAAQIRLAIETPTTVRALLDAVIARHPALAPYASSLRLAVNERYASADDIVNDGDEVALIPPVAGG